MSVLSRRSLTLIAALLLIFCAARSQALAAGGSGWSLDDDGLLTIESNDGAIAWKSARDADATLVPKVVRVVINEGVTRLEQRSFEDCTSLESFSFPKTLTRVTQHCFRNCSKLTEAILPAVDDIQNYAFYGCTSLKYVALMTLDTANNGVRILQNAFGGGTSLDSIDVFLYFRGIKENTFGQTSPLEIHIHTWTKYSQYIDAAAFADRSNVTIVINEKYTDASMISTLFGSGYKEVRRSAHAPAGPMVSDSAGHWLVCADDGEIFLRGDHTFGGWTISESDHSRECSVCFYKESGAHDESLVDAGDSHDTVCSKCGRGSAPSAHSYGGWKSDAAWHWKECECGHVEEFSAHSSGDICAVCGADLTREPETVAVISGSGTTWKTGDEGLVFVIAARADELTSAAVDLSPIAKGDYTAEDLTGPASRGDSAMRMTLSPSFLETLDEGEHRLLATFGSRICSASFSVESVSGGWKVGPEAYGACSSAPFAALAAMIAIAALRRRSKK